jgi:hypothetical protein
VLKVAGGGGGSGGILRVAIGVEFAGRCDSVIYLQINLRFCKDVELAASFASKNRLLMREDEIASINTAAYLLTCESDKANKCLSPVLSFLPSLVSVFYKSD